MLIRIVSFLFPMLGAPPIGNFPPTLCFRYQRGLLCSRWRGSTPKNSSDEITVRIIGIRNSVSICPTPHDVDDTAHRHRSHSSRGGYRIFSSPGSVAKYFADFACSTEAFHAHLINADEAGLMYTQIYKLIQIRDQKLRFRPTGMS